MIEIRKTEFFARWLDELRDIQAKSASSDQDRMPGAPGPQPSGVADEKDRDQPL